MMYLRQAYRAVLGTFLLASLAAQAEDRSADLVLLSPGKSITFVDAANPGINVVVTAPADSYINLSRVVAASEREGIYSIMTTMQVKAAGSVVSNSDGTVSLRPAPGESYFVPKSSAPDPRHVTLEGGVAVLDRGRAVIHSENIVHARPLPITGAMPVATSVLPINPTAAATVAAPRAALPGPASVIVPTGSIALNPSVVVPTGGIAMTPAVSLPVGTGIITLGGFNVGSGASVNISQPSGGVTTLNGVTGGGNIQLNGTLTTAGGIKSPAPVIVTPR